MTINVELRDEQAARLDRFATGLRQEPGRSHGAVDRRRPATRRVSGN